MGLWKHRMGDDGKVKQWRILPEKSSLVKIYWFSVIIEFVRCAGESIVPLNII